MMMMIMMMLMWSTFLRCRDWGESLVFCFIPVKHMCLELELTFTYDKLFYLNVS